MTTARYGYEPLPSHGTLFRGTTTPADLRVVCLWAALGLALTGLFCAMGLGIEIGQSLMAAG